MDPYTQGFIKNYLLMDIAHITGRHVKLFASMGDRFASYAYIITFSEGRVADPEVAKRILKAAVVAFNEPSAIACVTDREPVFSMFLCERVFSESNSEEVRRTAGVVLGKLRKAYE